MYVFFFHSSWWEYLIFTKIIRDSNTAVDKTKERFEKTEDNHNYREIEKKRVGADHTFQYFQLAVREISINRRQS
jgi:hypothetical protein